MKNQNEKLNTTDDKKFAIEFIEEIDNFTGDEMKNIIGGTVNTVDPKCGCHCTVNLWNRNTKGKE